MVRRGGGKRYPAFEDMLISGEREVPNHGIWEVVTNERNNHRSGYAGLELRNLVSVRRKNRK